MTQLEIEAKTARLVRQACKIRKTIMERELEVEAVDNQRHTMTITEFIAGMLYVAALGIPGNRYWQARRDLMLSLRELPWPRVLLSRAP